MVAGFKILLVATGGTIGSSSDEGVIRVDSASKHDLVQRFEKVWQGVPVSFEVCQPVWTLSENAVPGIWSQIVSAIRSYSLDEFDGVIVTHGTGTLPYTSAALSFALADVEIPVVMVSSDKPLSDSSGNGLSNFENAVHFILQDGFPGVYVIYRNYDGISYVHIGSRLTAASPFNHAFRSEKDAHIGVVKDSLFRACSQSQSFFDSKRIAGFGKNSAPLPSFSAKIHYIHPYPGLDYRFFDLSEAPPLAVLHGLYHCGTACTSPPHRENSILRFAEQCADRGIDFYVVPAPNGSDMYETFKKLLGLCATPLYDMATEAAIVKLMMAYGQFSDHEKAKEFVTQRELFFEWIK